MSKEEIKTEINKVLDNFPDKALGEILALLKKLDLKQNERKAFTSLLNKIIEEDKELLAKLAE